MTFTLKQILPDNILLLVDNDKHDSVIRNIHADSRKIGENDIYVAVRGAVHDGFDFVDSAISSGASVVICDVNHKYHDKITQYPNVIFIPVPFVRLLLSYILSTMFAPMPKYMAAVTGTNGKTSTADFSRQILTMMNIKSASVGTLGVICDGKTMSHGHTTPDPEILYPLLNDLQKNGTDYVIFEASSHGLEQSRLHGLSFLAAGFTNFTRDHLDYHATEQAYFEAKKILFDDLVVSGGLAVIYHDDNRSDDMIQAAQNSALNIITIGHTEKSDIYLKNIVPVASGLDVEYVYNDRIYHTHLNLCGGFQVINVFTAVCLVYGMTQKSLGISLVDLFEYLPDLKTVDGRMDYVGTYHGGSVYVDYAHTPDALEKAILSLKPHCSGKIITVFGCGGNRDSGKRPQMGKIAQTYSDIVIITDDNPRGEDSTKIHDDILKGCVTNEKISVIKDRKQALSQALDKMEQGDIMLVAGKGHEDGQMIGTQKFPFKDAVIVNQLIQEKL
jgi:UDP-N-acetylmuramoyl-L-alanyl-D-glutamate--2,6-diaminopimelate ligase